MKSPINWTGTGLQIAGCIILALNLSWSGWAFPLMLAGSLIWVGTATLRGDGALAALNAGFALINILGIARRLF